MSIFVEAKLKEHKNILYAFMINAFFIPFAEEIKRKKAQKNCFNNIRQFLFMLFYAAFIFLFSPFLLFVVLFDILFIICFFVFFGNVVVVVVVDCCMPFLCSRYVI